MKIIKNFYRCIRTKYLGATSYKPSRIKAIDGKRSVTISYDDGLSTCDNHVEAIKALCKKYDYGWGQNWGVTAEENSSDYIFFSMGRE